MSIFNRLFYDRFFPGPALIEATRQNDTLRLRSLLATADVNYLDTSRHIESITDWMSSWLPRMGTNPSVGTTALQIAAHDMNAAAVADLIASEADVNLADKYGENPLYCVITSTNAFRANSVEVLQLLLNAGADPNRHRPYGGTLLNYAASPRFNNMGTIHTHFVAYLLEAGAEVNAADNYGEIPLISASGAGEVGIIAFLLAAGANINALDPHGNTALMRATNGAVIHLLNNPSLENCLIATPAALRTTLVRLWIKHHEITPDIFGPVALSILHSNTSLASLISSTIKNRAWTRREHAVVRLCKVEKDWRSSRSTTAFWRVADTREATPGAGTGLLMNEKEPLRSRQP